MFHDQVQVDEYVSAMRSCLPDGLPLVKKRDAHASNWVVDTAGRLIAVDLEAVSFLPVVHDIAQLIEDCGLLPVNNEGFSRRVRLVKDYAGWLDIDVDEGSGIGRLRLVRTVPGGQSRFFSQRPQELHHIHARQLVAYLASTTGLNDLRECARMVRHTLHHSETSAIPQIPDSTHRRLSKRLAWVLRHEAPQLGLTVNDAGFVLLEQLADAVNMTPAGVLNIATHPAEPRFEVESGCVRALYGHSFEVADLPDLDVGYASHTLSWHLMG